MLALKNIGTYCLQSCVNIASNFEGFSGIATVWVWWKCNKYITFSRCSCDAGIGCLKFWSNEVFFKPKRFSSLGISLINLIKKHILFHPKTKGMAIYIYRCLDTINPKYINDISTTDDVIKWNVEQFLGNYPHINANGPHWNTNKSSWHFKNKSTNYADKIKLGNYFIKRQVLRVKLYISNVLLRPVPPYGILFTNAW